MDVALEYRTIPLSQGKFAIVDATDYDWLMQWKWYAKWDRCTHGFYAVRNVWINTEKCRTISMHRLILGLEFGDKRQVDHHFHNTLDNRRIIDGVLNLRIASCQQNTWNQGIRRTNTSGFKGVMWRKDTQRWRVRIMAEGHRIHLGEYDTAEAAHVAYCEAAERLHGEFKRTA